MKDSKKKTAANNEYSWSRVAFVFIDGSIKIINTGKVYPLIWLIFMVIMTIIVWRIPEHTLGELALFFVTKIVMSYGGLIVLLLLSNFSWKYIFDKQRENYEKEIQRITKVRSELMHNSDRVKIKNHRSTEDDCKEVYLIPDTTKGK